MPPIENIPPKDQNRDKKLEAFDRLLTIMDELRLNCPWDKKQTMESLRHLSIEEVYELGDSILDNDLQSVKGELGDLMLHIAFYTRIAKEKGEFDMEDVLNTICDKLINRHPHIYSDVKVASEEEVKANWEEIKLKEKKNKGVLDGVPKSLPAMVKAQRIQEKVRGVGFDWEEKHQVWEKVQEEINEFKSEFNADMTEVIDREKAENEFGDLLFSLINYARFIDINPEDSLEKTNRKFIKRFNYLEKESNRMGKALKDMSLAEMDEIWEKAKKL